jgi:nucleoside triphosphate diphosphatase
VGGGDGLEQALVELQELAERLRRDCPWDRAQTAKTIVPHTVEEAYEVADAALAEDDAKLLDELGDLLFQTVFLALLLEERGSGDLAEVARGIRAKLIRRHPHVFGDAELETPAAVKGRWEELKREQEEREGIFHHVPEQLPPLLHARKVQKRAASAGFDYPNLEGALGDLDDELAELREAIAAAPERAAETEPDADVFDELGDLLFAAVNVSRRLDVDPELALRAASRRFVERVERAAELAGEEGRDWESLPLEEQDRYFDRAKEGIR